jgi:hypothetical protein
MDFTFFDYDSGGGSGGQWLDAGLRLIACALEMLAKGLHLC